MFLTIPHRGRPFMGISTPDEGRVRRWDGDPGIERLRPRAAEKTAGNTGPGVAKFLR